MSVRLVLDQGTVVYTNLDVVSGKVLLNLPREETLAAITVKLEAESRTRLAAPLDDRRGRSVYDTQLEVHKLLYKTMTVFPTAQLAQSAPTNASFTLIAGLHEYPFQFKIPFNNACTAVNTFIDSFHGPVTLEHHLKRPLPPSLTGFRGEADIRYYVKVTAQRPAFYKENYRSELTFKFLPIEPPRPEPNKRESYARRQHQFAPPLKSPRRGSGGSNEPPPLISVDGRLPDPATVTCNEPLPLRVLVKKLNQTSEQIFLQLFQIMLAGYTHVRAHDLRRVEQSSWIMTSKANLSIPLTASPSGDLELDSNMWRNIPIPNSVPPSFETCNLARKYELEISVGLGFGTPGSIKPEMTVQTLRMPVQVYSGIRPPPALLQEMAKHNPALVPSLRPGMPLRPATQSQQNEGPSPSPVAIGHSPTATSHAAPGPSDLPDEPPPSYEDAMADDLAPVDGSSRPRNYEQPEGEPVRDEKRSSLFGQKERLFP